MYIYVFRLRSRGFGFITYKFSMSVDEAQGNRPHTIDNKEVETKRATPREVLEIYLNSFLLSEQALPLKASYTSVYRNNYIPYPCTVISRASAGPL